MTRVLRIIMSTDAELRLPGNKPNPFVAPLNVETAQKSTSPGAQSTRRRWSVQGLFSPLSGTPRSNDGSETTRLPLKEVVERLHEIPFADDQSIKKLGKRMLDLMPNFDKIAVATKEGALEAVVHALEDCGRDEKIDAEAASALLPALCNLSAGEDEAGMQRASKLVSLGAVEAVTTLLRVHAPDESKTSLDIVFRGVWALQHLCRKEQLLYRSTSTWLARLLHCDMLDLLVALPSRFPTERKLLCRSCFMLSSVCHALVEHAKATISTSGRADTLAISSSAELTKCIPAIACALRSEVDPSPTSGAEVHEAAALALGDACSSSELCRLALDHRVLESLTAALAVQTDKLAFRGNGEASAASWFLPPCPYLLVPASLALFLICPVPRLLPAVWAIRAIFEHSDASDRERLRASTAVDICERILCKEKGTLAHLGAEKVKALQRSVQRMNATDTLLQLV